MKGDNMQLYILVNLAPSDWDQTRECTILANSEEEAKEMSMIFNRPESFTEWIPSVKTVVDMSKAQVLSSNYVNG